MLDRGIDVSLVCRAFKTRPISSTAACKTVSISRVLEIAELILFIAISSSFCRCMNMASLVIKEKASFHETVLGAQAFKTASMCPR